MHLLVLEQGKEHVQNNNEKTTVNEKFYVNQLIIPNVQRHDSGRYFCVVTNTAGQFVYHSAYLEVINGMIILIRI